MSFSQQNPAKKYVRYNKNLDFEGQVKSVFVKDFFFKKKGSKMDTTLAIGYKILYHINKNTIKRFDYRSPFLNPYQEVNYDDSNRIVRVKAKRANTMFLDLKQFFSNDRKSPDSINYYNNKGIRGRHLKNYFKNGLVIRQDNVTHDTLRSYLLFNYDSKGRVVKKINVNTKNGNGITFGSSLTGGKVETQLYPNDTTSFTYKSNGDTLIIIKEIKNKLFNIKKNYKSDNVEININEDHMWGYLSREEINYKWTDSSMFEAKSYNKDGGIYRFSVGTSKKDNNIITNSHRSSNKRLNSNSTIYVEIIHDSNGNWIEKKYLNKGVLEHIITRDINYF